MRLIDADKLTPDRMTDKGLAISQSQIANTPTVDAIPKSVIEDIRAEFEKYQAEQDKQEMFHFLRMKMCDDFAEIIDKHINGKE